MTPSKILEGKVAWVTGASSGIGRATARALADAGATLVLGDINREALAETLEDRSGAHLALRQDVTSVAEWQTIAAQVAARFGRLDVLVNNAGIMLNAPLVGAPVEDLRRQYAINVESVFVGMQTAFPLMQQAIVQGTASTSIINISSVYGMVAGGSFAAYSASIGAVRGLSRAAAAEWAKCGVRVNCVLPGPVQTNLGADWDPPVDAEGNPISPEAALAAWASLIPMGRLGQASDIAPLVAFLASDAAGFVTGAEFVADGGYTAI